MSENFGGWDEDELEDFFRDAGKAEREMYERVQRELAEGAGKGIDDSILNTYFSRDGVAKSQPASSASWSIKNAPESVIKILESALYLSDVTRECDSDCASFDGPVCGRNNFGKTCVRPSHYCDFTKCFDPKPKPKPLVAIDPLDAPRRFGGD